MELWQRQRRISGNDAAKRTDGNGTGDDTTDSNYAGDKAMDLC